jgi:23S rRNA pseudouridine1911/1915/1917 synthase
VKLPANELVRPAGVPEGSVVSVFWVPPEVAGQRLDVFLQSQLRRTSRTRTQIIVRASAFDREGRRLKPNDRVAAGQLVFLWRAPWDEDPVPTEIPILYEDEHLLAVDKPAHLPVHPTARYHKNTLIKLMQAERPDQFLSLGHRIDRETSGVLLVSKHVECDRALKRALEEREDIEKEYVAITWGVPEGGEPGRTFRCDLGLELDPTSPLRVKMRVGQTPDALSAATDFTIEAIARAGERSYARVRCALHTGRQHQIRVHLASLGAPIVGDKLYGPDERMFARAADGELTDEDRARLELPRHALHAARLALPHPITGERLEVRAPLPDDLDAFWNAMSAGAENDRTTE